METMKVELIDINSFGKYEIIKEGVNLQGNEWSKVDFGSGVKNRNTFFYRNRDGSTYSKHPDGSSLYVNKYGIAYFTPAPSEPLPECLENIKQEVKVEVKQEPDLIFCRL